MSALQIRNVPDDVHQILKQRAARSGQSLSEYMLTELSQSARQPTLEEITERIAKRGVVSPVTAAADLLRAERDRR